MGSPAVKEMDLYLDAEVTSGLDNYIQPITLSLELPTRVYGCMLAIWLLRPQLQRRFPLNKGRSRDYIRFLAWCATEGRREYTILRDLKEWNRELNQPISLPMLKNDEWTGNYTVGMFLIGIAHSQFWIAPILTNSVVRNQVAHWYWYEGRHELALDNLPAWQVVHLKQKFSTPAEFLQSLLTNQKDNSKGALKKMLGRNQDLVRCWRNCSKEAIPCSVRAPGVSLIATLTSYLAPKYLNELAVVRNLLVRMPAQKPVTQTLNQIRLNRKPITLDGVSYPFGVNLFGYARGELGIGEDVRMLAYSLSEAQVPFCIVNVQPGDDVSQSDKSVENWITDRPRYLINIFCMTGIEQVRLVCENGIDRLCGRYNIGLWPWELPQWPDCWHHAWNTVNEIWGISEYTAAAYKAAPLPVRPVPLPVKLGPLAPLMRDDFMLPESAYLFVFSFDLNSTLTRKNPQAIVAAFKQAFPSEGAEQVGLVIKVNHPREKDKAWRAFKRAVAGDMRIHLIEGAMRKSDVLALYKCCNCFVSLHRSEGFGRGIAEAQLLGMEVITTCYSGNAGFCSQGPTEQVSYSMRPVRANEYFCADGQHWAEPNSNHAAALMQKVYIRRRESGEVKYDTERFSTSYCGDIYSKRLSQIQNMIKAEGVTLC